MEIETRLRQAQTDRRTILYLFFILLLMTNCTTNKTIDVQGHRGCRGLLPENSLPAFEKAIDLSVNMPPVINNFQSYDICENENNNVVE